MTVVPRSTIAGLIAALSEGTVTEFLEELACEPIDADIITQSLHHAGPDNPLALEADAELLRRSVLLTGSRTGRRFAYAESAIATGRLPHTVRPRLEQSRDPIGRVLLDHRLAVRREPLTDPAVAVHSDCRIQAIVIRSVWSRRYRIMAGGDPVILVSEWFLDATAKALAVRSHA